MSATMKNTMLLPSRRQQRILPARRLPSPGKPPLRPPVRTPGDFSADWPWICKALKTQSRADTTRILNAIITGNDITINTNPPRAPRLLSAAHPCAKDTLEIVTHDLNVSASSDTYQAKQDTKDLSGSLSMTMYGGGSGMPEVWATGKITPARRAPRTPTRNFWPRISNLTVANDALFEGATVRADDTLDLKVGNDLDIISLRDSSSSNSKGFNIGAGFSLGQDQDYTGKDRTVGQGL